MQYPHKKKVKLASKIQSLSRRKDFIKIGKIISQDNTISAMENYNGMFMYFHKLSNETYLKLENELKEIDRKQTQKSLDSATSDSISNTASDKPYAKDDFPSQKHISPKLKFSNREKSLIKRRRYDKNINMYNDTENDSEVVYTNYDATAMSEMTTSATNTKSPEQSSTLNSISVEVSVEDSIEVPIEDSAPETKQAKQPKKKQPIKIKQAKEPTQPKEVKQSTNRKNVKSIAV